MRRTLILIFLMAMVVAACSSGDADSIDPTGTEETLFFGNQQPAIGAEAEPPPKDTAEGRLTSFDDLSTAGTDQHIIRDAFVELRVEDFELRWDDLRRMAADLGGFVSDASTGIDEHQEGRFARGTATLRVPSDRFEDALDRIGALGERLNLTMSGQDVSEEYVDLEARLRHWRALEEFHLGLLESSETIDEALRVQDRLSGVQIEIERIEGRLRYLDSRTSMSSITVSMTEAPTPVPVQTTSVLGDALDRAKEVILGIFSFLIVAAAAVVPVGLLVLVVVSVLRISRRIAGGAPRTTET